MLQGLAPRPKSARQRQQVKFLQQEQQAEQEKRKKKQQEKLAKQRIGLESLDFLQQEIEENIIKKRKGVKRKSSENDPQLTSEIKKRAPPAPKVPKPEVGGAGSLKCIKKKMVSFQIQ